ncbi:MAG TPA: hypothetical protein VKY65_05590 [Alphaproteobacteria bacterium]|nr:hypothetical protein [Alphaproteobacteria bacterium]
MLKFASIVALVIVVVIVGGAVFLGTWQIPAPTAKVEKVIPNDRFPH